MSQNQNAEIWATAISAMAANRAIVRLHALLAVKGDLNEQEIEALRHLHLHDFDVSFESMPNERARKAIDETRAQLDALWQAANQVPLLGPEPTE